MGMKLNISPWTKNFTEGASVQYQEYLGLQMRENEKEIEIYV
jgi:hypothetical protein